MDRISKTLMFAGLCGAAAAGLATLFVLLSFRGEPQEGVAVLGVYASLASAAAAAGVGAILYWVFMRFMTIDAFARLVSLILLGEIVVCLTWDSFGSAESRWFGAFLVFAWIVVLLVFEARRTATYLRSEGA